MITFKQYLTEIFKQHYKVQNLRPNDDEAAASRFETDKGNHYHVKVQHHSRNTPDSEAAFSFHATDSRHSIKLNKSEGVHSVKIFSTMHHIMKHHMQENPKINHMSFDAANSEPSRVKLYRHLAKHFAHKHTETQTRSDSTHFKIHRKDIK